MPDEKKVVKSAKIGNFKAVPGVKSFNCHARNMGSKIIKHYSHSYDKAGNVIVIRDKDEDVTLTVKEFEAECGKKNIVAMMKAGADVKPLLTAGVNEGVYGNFVDMDYHGENELSSALENATKNSLDALKVFNEKYGLSLTMDQLLEAQKTGTLETLVIASLNAQQIAKQASAEKPKEGGAE